MFFGSSSAKLGTAHIWYVEDYFIPKKNPCFATYVLGQNVCVEISLF